MMKKARKISRGDTVGVVSLSTGVLGEEFVQHEVKIFERRLREELGLKIQYMNNARKGIDYLKAHPEARAEDLKQAFLNPEVKVIWSAIGGAGAIELAPYLFTQEFKKIVQDNPKVFIGFSDTTAIHLILYKLGLKTFYGPALLPDVAELGPEMLPFTKEWILTLFENPDGREIVTSPVWYRSRTKFDESQVGVPAEEVREEHGTIFFNGEAEKQTISGELFGGCLDLLAGILNGEHPEAFPEKGELKGKILFIESSDNQPTPEEYEKMIETLEERGVFEEVVGVMVGKPMDEKYFSEYREVMERVGERYKIPIVYNLNFGHATPRMILPYGEKVEINLAEKRVMLRGKMLED